MMEIYNEKIRDLLNPDPKTNNDLKVRTTPKGTFVEGCKAKAVSSFDAINREMENGTASRTVAATQMNATSSRAHTVSIKKADRDRTRDVTPWRAADRKARSNSGRHTPWRATTPCHVHAISRGLTSDLPYMAGDDDLGQADY